MKKFIVSSIVIGGFVVYSWYQRVYGAQIVPAIVPKSPPIGLSQNTPIATPTPSATPTPVPTIVPQSTPVDTPTPTPTSVPTPTPSSGYKDGTFTGSTADAFYGSLQVQATISGGKLSNVQFLQYPDTHGTSIMINQQADPMLTQEAIQAQSANVNIISGATFSSQAFIQSLQTALNQAKS